MMSTIWGTKPIRLDDGHNFTELFRTNIIYVYVVYDLRWKEMFQISIIQLQFQDKY